jgi:hypothetical protein
MIRAKRKAGRMIGKLPMLHIRRIFSALSAISTFQIQEKSVGKILAFAAAPGLQ